MTDAFDPLSLDPRSEETRKPADVDRVADIEERLAAAGWSLWGEHPGRYRVWGPATGTQEIIVPTNPTAGDFDRLLARAERDLDPGDVQRLTNALHANRCHPDFEYLTTTIGRKAEVDPTPDSGEHGDGWEPNTTGGWHSETERFEWTEEYYWRRKRLPS